LDTNKKGVEDELLRYLCATSGRSECNNVKMTRTNLAGDKYFKDVEELTHVYD